MGELGEGICPSCIFDGRRLAPIGALAGRHVAMSESTSNCSRINSFSL